MLLEIDIGNTRLKWRLRNQQSASDTLAVIANIESEASFDSIFGEADLSSVRAVHVACVVPAVRALLASWCRNNLSCEPVFAEVETRCSGVVNGYHDVSQMGVDRWLALLAAYEKYRSACLVVDVGSAATIDLLQANGKHLGGYIVPGLQMMNSALFRDTGRVKLASVNYADELRAGTSTREAVVRGLPLMLLGLIRLAYDELTSSPDVNQAPMVVLTGGDAQYMTSQLRSQLDIESIEWAPDLVLDGLCLNINA